MSAESEALLYAALQRKARSEVERLLQASRTTEQVAGMILGLIELNGGIEVLDEARTLLQDARVDVREAIDALARVAEELRSRAVGVTLHFDLAELRGYAYHTGIVYAAFVPGHGREIARGGRYDDIGKEFGTTRPGTGFSMDLKLLVELSGFKPVSASAECIVAPWSRDAALLEAVAALREQGERVLFDLPGGQPGAHQEFCNRALMQVDGRWEIVSI